MNMKSKKKPKSIVEIVCKECGRVTKHYLSGDGTYKCMICGQVNKVLKQHTN